MVSAHQALSFICLAVVVSGNKKKAFLSLDKDAELWNAFQQSEKTLQQGSMKALRSRYIPTPLGRGASDSSDLEQWEKIHYPEIRLVHPQDGPYQPLVVNFSVSLLPGIAPCEDKIQLCAVHQNTCRHKLNDIQTDIIETMNQLAHIHENEPLLNTLAVGANIEADTPSVPKGEQNIMPRVGPIVSSGLGSHEIPTVTRNRNIGPRDMMALVPNEEDATSGPALAPPGLTPGKPKELSHWRLNATQASLMPSWQDNATAPKVKLPRLHRRHLPDGALRRHIAVHIANQVATHLSDTIGYDKKALLHHELRLVNETCDGDQKLELEDCQAYIQACHDTINHKQKALRGEKLALRDAQIELNARSRAW